MVLVVGGPGAIGTGAYNHFCSEPPWPWALVRRRERVSVPKWCCVVCVIGLPWAVPRECQGPPKKIEKKMKKHMKTIAAEPSGRASGTAKLPNGLSGTPGSGSTGAEAQRVRMRGGASGAHEATHVSVARRGGRKANRNNRNVIESTPCWLIELPL